MTVLVTLAVLVALGGAVLVVTRSARKAKLGPAPVSFRKSPKDSTLVSFQRGMLRRAWMTARRIERKQAQAGTLTPRQDSLAGRSDSAVAAMRHRLMLLDSLPTVARRWALMESIKDEYLDLRQLVQDFVRSVTPTEDTLGEDSLDTELRKLISE